MPLFLLAIAAGALTILAPCILPILPFILGTSGGKSKLRPFMIIVGFVGSFSVIGAALATAGSFLGIGGDTLRIIAAALLMLFGLALVFDGAYEKFSAWMQPRMAKLGGMFSKDASAKSDALSGLLVGISLGIIWTPCAGPILGIILTLAAKTKDFLTTLLLMLAYSLGAGLPMFGIAYGSHKLQERIKKMGAAYRALNIIFGLLIIALAIALMTHADIALQNWLLQYYPQGILIL